MSTLTPANFLCIARKFTGNKFTEFTSGETLVLGPALIPAAGESVRMGRPKLLLPLGGLTILERVVSAARMGGASRSVVVVRPDDADLANAGRAAGADVVRLPAATPDMRATVIAGLNWIEAHVAAHERPGFFLILGLDRRAGP